MIQGVGRAALTGTLFAVAADTMEYGQWKTGKRIEGMLYSSITFALPVEYGVTPQAVLDVLTGTFTPEGLLPVQLPADMDTVERQCEGCGV